MSYSMVSGCNFLYFVNVFNWHSLESLDKTEKMNISRYRKLCFLFHFILSIVFPSKAQNSELDSLKHSLQNHHSEDTVKANLLIAVCKLTSQQTTSPRQVGYFAPQLLSLSTRLAFQKGIAYGFYYMSMTDFKKTDETDNELYLKKSMGIMQQLKDKPGTILCLDRLGRIKGGKNQYSEAIQFYLRAIQLKESIQDLEGIADGYSWIGRVHTHLGSYDKALEYYIKALKIAESINYKKKICEAYISMGVIFYEQKKFIQTIAYMNKALAVEGNSTNKQNLSYIYNNLAIAYQNLNDHAAALSYHFKALKLNEEMGNDGGVAVSYNNIAGVYASVGKTKEALHYITKAMKLNEKNKDKVGLTYSYIGAGDCYRGNKNFAAATMYYQKALKIAKEINYKTEEREAYEHLSDMYEEIKDYQKAIEYHKKYAQIKDSILSEESLKQSSELNIRYETEKKEKEILLLTKDQELKNKTLKEQRLIRMGLIVGLLLLLILSFLLFTRYRFKQKANLLLEKQKEEIRQKNILITDSIDYAKNIQDAMLPASDYLSALLPDHFVFYKPKDIVSGDFYWVSKKENKIILAVADCTGHGVPGAFMSLLGHNMLGNVVSKVAPNPGNILTVLNQEIVARFSSNKEESKHGMDIAIITIDLLTSQLEFAGAKNALYLIRQNSLQEIKGDKVALGTPSENEVYFEYCNHIVQLQKGDMLYLFSDGFPDQRGGEKKKKFFYQPFKELLISISDFKPDEQRARLDSTIQNWMGAEEQMDDMLIVGIKY